MLVPTALVPVDDDEGNIIWVLPKMGRGVETRVKEEFRRIGGSTVDGYMLALLYWNVKKWEGPAFTDEEGNTIPCTRVNIDRLDPDEPLVEAVLEKISELNPPKTAVPEPAINGANPTQAAKSPKKKK